jgi:hypothetical protein
MTAEIDLVTAAEASLILGGRRLEPYYRNGARITPAMRAGSGKRSPLLFHRADVERLRDEILAKLEADVERMSASCAKHAS